MVYSTTVTQSVLKNYVNCYITLSHWVISSPRVAGS